MTAPPAAPTAVQAPVELVFQRSRRSLLVRFPGGEEGEIPYELLRVESPSAEVQGHGGAPPPPPAGKRAVGVIGADPVGRYAVRIRFDDGHDTGLFTWGLLRELASEQETRMTRYLQRLASAGLSRD